MDPPLRRGVPCNRATVHHSSLGQRRSSIKSSTSMRKCACSPGSTGKVCQMYYFEAVTHPPTNSNRPQHCLTSVTGKCVNHKTIKEYDLLYEKQSGFLPGHDTQKQLLTIDGTYDPQKFQITIFFRYCWCLRCHTASTLITQIGVLWDKG
jgi:hypothetical protein